MPTMPTMPTVLALITLAATASACGTDTTATDTASPPKTYRFASRSTPSKSSVAYSGQTHRQVLISDFSAWILGLTAEIDGGKIMAKGDVEAGCDFYFKYDAAVGADVAIGLLTSPATLQKQLGELGSKNLRSKVAGNDAKGQRKDWTKNLAGWSGQGSAEALLRSWFVALDAAAVARSAGSPGKAPDGSDLKWVHVSPQGRNYHQLIAKFLLVSIAMTQGMDDYLDDDIPGAGLRSQHTQPDADGALYTTLEHAWDEAFGYFGAARDYNEYSDDEIAGKGGRDGWKNGYHDSDGDGKIDLFSEINFGHAVNAAKRDRAAKSSAPTDFTGAAFDAFLAGRHLLAQTKTTLTPQQFIALQGYRDAATRAWELAVAATVVRYLNKVLQHMAKFGQPGYDFYAHAQHWSELKGFALGLQFNPRSPLKTVDFVAFHGLIGDAPVLATATALQRKDARKAVLVARQMLATTYDFDPKLMGDANGLGGW